MALNYIQIEVIDIQCDSHSKAKCIAVGFLEFYKLLTAMFLNINIKLSIKYLMYNIFKQYFTRNFDA